MRLFETAHRKGIKILIDLVPGHTSEEHEWFRRSSEACPNEYSSRYIWTDHWIKGIGGHPYIGGESPRNGTYMLNFFKCQPALNYGWASPSETWQSAIDSPEALATRDAMIDVMLFWLNLGCDGFRVDMADSLAKDDDSSKSATCLIWRYILSACRSKFPSAAFVSEWSCPVQSINGAGFDMDFYLDRDGNGYNRLVRSSNSYFNGECSFNEFLDDYIPALRDTSHNGLICMMTCNHDTVRPSHFLSDRALRLFLYISSHHAGRTIYLLWRRNRYALSGSAVKRRRLRPTGSRTRCSGILQSLMPALPDSYICHATMLQTHLQSKNRKETSIQC